MKRFCLVLLAGLALAGCSKEDNNGPSNIQFDRDTGGNQNNTANNTTPDAGAADTGAADDMGTPDVGMDMDVTAPGFMHGEWSVTRATGTAVATLNLRHEAGETAVTGTFTMTEPAGFGTLGGSNWLDDTFTTSWTVQIDGLDERFGLAMCARDGGDDLLACRFTDPIEGNVVDAFMTRQ